MRRVASGVVLAFGVLTVQSFVHAQEQTEVPVVRSTFRAEAGKAPYFQFKLPTYYRDGRIVGNALASGGSGNDIRVLLLTEQQFQAWYIEPAPLYDSGRRQSVVLSVPVSDPGTYYILFDNTFSAVAPKNVQADIRFVHRGVDTSRAAEMKRQALASLEQSLKQLEDPNWKNREEAFYGLLGLGASVYQEPNDALASLLQKFPEKSDEIKLALIEVLEREHSFQKKYDAEYRRTGVHPGAEGYGEGYYANLIWAVSSLKDVRSLNGLMGAITTGSMATSTLAGFGDAALDRVLEVFNSGENIARHSACGVLSEMLDEKNAAKVSNPVSRRKIKDALIRAAGDQSRFLRLGGIEGLAKLGDRDVIPLIRNLATSDPAKQVRDAADEALKKLR